MSSKPLHTAREAAALLDIKLRTFEAHRRRGSGPDFILIGRQYRYSDEALAEYVKRNTVQVAIAEMPT